VDRERVFGLHVEHPAVAAKELFQRQLTEQWLVTPDVESVEGLQRLVRNLVGYFVILEGIFFYSGFALALAFRQRNLLRGLCTIVDWVLKDESLHLSFGIHLITTILEEHPEIMSAAFGHELRELILRAVELEEAYNRAVLPEPLIGLDADALNRYVRYIADRRLEELGLPVAFGEPNPLRWMVAQVDMPEIVNFFEARNIHYEVGRARW
jgi:ribonucleoside-diphosphate reductase beta chain